MRYFVSITPANVLYALWLSLRGPVAAWKVDLPGWLAGRFDRVRPYRLLSRDEWLLAHDRAFDLWKSRAFPLLSARYRHEASFAGVRIDFSRNLWQLLGMEFEAMSLFVSMLGKCETPAGRRPVLIEPRIAGAFPRAELEALFPEVEFGRAPANRFLQHLREWGTSLAHLARDLAFAAMSFAGAAKPLGRRRIAWLGISPQEIPDSDGKLDFAWAVPAGYASAEDVVYFLPQALTPSQRAHLDARRLACVEPVETYRVLRPAERFSVITRTLVSFVKALAAPAAVAPLIARLTVRASFWTTAFRTLGTETYVTSTSYSWPEKPDLAVARALGIRSIIWAYSANSLTFSVESDAFRDVGVVRSIVIADEFWVWNRAYADWLKNRRVDESGNEVRVVGPLMCGDPAQLALDPADARERLGLPREGLCIGVFDMPPITDAWRDRFGGGPPMVDTGTYVEFWKVLERVVRRVPSAFALVKLKRDFTHAYREFPDVLRALLDENGEHMKAGRLRRVDVNVDPYLPVAACDIAIGIAYTSPVLAARAAGRPGFYLDPLRRANFPSEPEYKTITLHTEDEVVAEVMRALERTGVAPTFGSAQFAPISTPAAPSITPPPPCVPLGAPPP